MLAAMGFDWSRNNRGLVLRQLRRYRNGITAPRLAGTLGADHVSTVRGHLIRLASQGLAVYVPGRPGVWRAVNGKSR